MSYQHPIDLIPAFSLGSLDDEERQQVEKHLEVCEQCRSELTAYRRVVDGMAYATPEAVPSPDLKNRLLKRVRKTPVSYEWFNKLLGKWPRLVPIGALALLILLVSLGISSVILLNRAGMPNLEDVRIIVLKGTAEAPEAVGTLIIGADEQKGVFVVNSLPGLISTSQYQLWLIKDGQRTNGGVFSVLPQGQARLTVSAPRSLLSFDAFGVTIEPHGGSPGPTGKKVLGGKVQL